MLQEVRRVPRGSTLAAAAAISDTELVVDYAGDFSYDPENPDDTGGTLDLNGARLAYTSIIFGELPDDPDTIVLAEPLTVAADADDMVSAVAGGQVLEDWVAYVTMGEGDQVVVPLSVDQRNQWAIGVYEDPVPVIISDNLLHLEDAPGRTPPARVQFLNTDTGAVATDGDDIEIPLTYVPIAGSEQVFYNGTPLKRADWTRSDTVLTIPGETWFRANKVAWVDYAYDGAAARTGPIITSPENGESTTDTTPTISGNAAPLRPIEVFVDGVSVGTTTSDVGGAWSVTVGSALSTGSHTTTAEQTESDASVLTSPTITFIVISVPAAFRATSFVTGDHTSIALPAGTTAGDMLILVMCARVTAHPTDSRFPDPGFTDTCGGFGVAGVWVGTADGSGSPVSIDMVSAGIGDAADGAAVLMAISGSPLALTADQASTTSPSGTNPFTPTPAGGAPGLGIAAVFGVSGISSGSISEQTTNWTYRLGKQGGGAGKCSVYLGTASGVPAGTWETNGSTIIGGARIMGIQ
jgi:hypothetical protein